MKQFNKIINFILFFSLTSMIIVFAAENNLDTCEHNYQYSRMVNDCFVYTCTECSDENSIITSYVKEIWDIEALNKDINEVDNGYILDVVPDGFINAKDYAKIYHISKYGW